MEPVQANLPKIPPLFIMPANVDARRTKNNQTIINPITGNYLENDSDTRKRIKASVLRANEKREEVIRQRNEIARQRINSQYFVRAEVGDIFSNFMYVDLYTRGISTREQLYNFIKYEVQNIKDKTGGKWILTSVKLHWNAPRLRAIWRSIDGSYFTRRAPFDNFRDRIIEIERGNKDEVGSDPIDTDQYELEYSKVVLFFSKHIVEAKAVRNIFKVLDVNKNGKKDECFVNCLEELGLPYGCPHPIKTYGEMIEFIKANNMKVRIISNIIKNINFKDIEDNNDIINVKVGKNKSCYFGLKPNQFKITTLYQPEDTYNHTLLYCPIDKHIDIIPNNDIQLEDGVIISSSGRLFKKIEDEYTYLYDAKVVYDNDDRPKDKMEMTYVFFDYETIVEWTNSNCMEAYSLSWFWITHEEMTILSTEKGASYENVVKQTLDNKERCHNYVGFDCNDTFIDWVIKFQHGRILKFVSYNGANFDNFILFSAITDYKLLHKENNTIQYSAGDVQYNGNQLLNFKFNGRHSMYDLRKHLSGSLKSNCDGFKVPKQYSKQEIDHNKIQMKYNKCVADAIIDANITNPIEIDIAKRIQGQKTFIELMKEDEKLESYNNNDVLSLCVLFYKYYKALNDIKGFDFLSGEKFVDFRTIGSIIKKKFDLHCVDKKIKLPLLSAQQYSDTQQYKIAGRCDMFNGTQHINDEIVSLDVCSLYPYVMMALNCYYPCGEVKDAGKYYTPDDKIGFWYCDIDQSILKKHNLPNVYAEKTGSENLWESEAILKDYLISNITIELLKKYEKELSKKDGKQYKLVNVKNSIQIKDENGVVVATKKSYYFTDKMKSIKMFEFMAQLMKAKNDQDIAEGTEIYNPALRGTLKLLMNALSGKVIQGLFCDKISLLDNLDDYEKIRSKYDVNTINQIGDKIFVSYKVELEECIKRQSPIYLGCLIYEYARTYMYEKMLAPVGLDKCLYQDTDCLKFRKCDMINWMAKCGNEPVPHWKEIEEYDVRYGKNPILDKDNKIIGFQQHPLYSPHSKVFGSFENELKENNLFILLQKKFWLVANVKDGETTYIKTRYKGVNPRSIYLQGVEPFLTEMKDVKYKLIDGKKYKLKKHDIDIPAEQTITQTEMSIKDDYEDKDIFNWCMIDGNASKAEIGSDYDKGQSKPEKRGALKNQIQFFERIYNNGEAYVLCNNLRRVVKNSLRGVGVNEADRHNNNANTIQLKYLVKKIKLVA